LHSNFLFILILLGHDRYKVLPKVTLCNTRKTCKKQKIHDKVAKNVSDQTICLCCSRWSALLFTMGSRFSTRCVNNIFQPNYSCSFKDGSFVLVIDYKYLGVLRSLFPTVPIVGLTATATINVTNDVQKMLNMKNCLVFKASFNRPNLYYEVFFWFIAYERKSFKNLYLS
jgi:hypothetical protein